ncbi:DUF2635 domain-containing protein [Lichenicola cladoniae]|uniref:DUF2635 domain-containing protein n=1 Tax=Lichenicola cladoniae TaxID=1484109 RepID=A0A6M8HN91_9PROT|nr:DUF2635 domain-containing protein [Lichenicola cladoniae]NPD67299.1 DUF2635 domain-containing protein [Acetobacteraceae bacterium]QKE89802.1 DUF2635 domain-containing protein [Lichenicola cladoniae]
MRIKPASGLKVRDHVTRQLLPEDGIDVADTNGVPHHPYWQQLMNHGDVVAEEPPQEAAALPALPDHNPDADSGS